ncbi:hypothetical protein Mco01_06330 [Microbispora corallina]|uniref:Uncharacterized protein n=1 Tax=Microbispora corallina TaxID=83302 RepID=A0ABQ4FS46_9ACTN|nr:hypothetical protein Mco01_06330 [Microbispora corallina]
MPVGEGLGAHRLVGGHVVLDDGAQNGELAVVEQGVTSCAWETQSLALCVPECQVYGYHPAACDNTMGSRGKRTANPLQVTYAKLPP